MDKVAAQNIAWVRAPVTWVMRPGWAETIWSIEATTLGLVSKGFLIDPLKCLILVLHGLLCDFPNIQATQGEIFLIFSEIPWYYPP